MFICLQLLCYTITFTSGLLSVLETHASIKTLLGYVRPLNGHVSYERTVGQGGTVLTTDSMEPSGLTEPMLWTEAKWSPRKTGKLVNFQNVSS